MMLNAGNKNFPHQRFGYGPNGAEAPNDKSFSDDEDDDDGEHEEGDSDFEDGELNSAQKKKLQ